MVHDRSSKGAYGLISRGLGRIAALTLMLIWVCAMLLPHAPAMAAAPAGYELMAGNSDVTVYYDPDTLALCVEDKSTGSVMYSVAVYDDGKNNATWTAAMRSAITMTLINGADDTKQVNSYGENMERSITQVDGGFDAELHWRDYGLRMKLEVRLTEDGLTARIPDESIVEENDRFYIGTIAVYPYMGCSYMTDNEGYLFVPDGNGALIYLDDKEGRFSTGYSAMIYGSDVGFEESSVKTLLWERYDTISDSEQVVAPVYGIAHTDDEMAYLAVVEEGAERASVNAMPNGVNVDYNRAYARFTLRRLYTQPTSNNSTTGSMRLVEEDRSHSDLQVRFIFLSGDRAGYAGMAGAYRDYLLERGELVPVDTAYRTRVDFLGTDRQSFLLGTKAVVMTTAEDIRAIYEDLAQRGVDSLLSVYKGWQKKGLYNIPIMSYKADSKIGGTGELTKLIGEINSTDSRMYLYDDALRINPDEQNATFNVVKQVNKRRYEEETYMDVYEDFLYLTPARSAELASRLFRNAAKSGVTSFALAGTTDTIFTYTYSGDKYTRFDCADTLRDSIDGLAQGAELALESPNAYLWKDMSAYLDMPLYTSSFIVEDESVPFLSIVLKGIVPVYGEYVNFEANRQEFFLKLVETGTYPSFYITKEDTSELLYTNSRDIYSSQYDAYSEAIVTYDEALRSFAERTKGATIEAHDLLPEGLTRVTYSNGVRVYLNYTDVERSADGVSVAPMDYQVR